MGIVRAWKDPEYRAGLTGEELDGLPPNPAGVVELAEDDLFSLVGGTASPATPAPPIVTAAVGCYTVGVTVCNGTCKAFGTQGCC